MTDLRVRKQALRAEARAARAAACAAVPDAAARAAAHVGALAEALGAPGIASGYLPVRDEIDPRPAMTVLADHGWRLALPVVTGPGEPLVFRGWAPGEPTVAAPFGLRIPAAETEVVPDLLLVPMLAFDRRGHRLGYGGGFYDRTLAALRAGEGRVHALGLAFAAQEMPLLPASDTDMRLDAIVTEAGAIRLLGEISAKRT